jgi:hypothetical protein
MLERWSDGAKANVAEFELKIGRSARAQFPPSWPCPHIRLAVMGSGVTRRAATRSAPLTFSATSIRGLRVLEVRLDRCARLTPGSALVPPRWLKSRWKNCPWVAARCRRPSLRPEAQVKPTVHRIVPKNVSRTPQSRLRSVCKKLLRGASLYFCRSGIVWFTSRPAGLWFPKTSRSTVEPRGVC